MSLDLPERELIAVGISVAAGCKPCTTHHVKAARDAGALDSDVRGVIEVAVSVRRQASDIMKAYALKRSGLATPESRPRNLAADEIQRAQRTGQLVSVGAAFAVNCTTSLRRHVSAAKAIGVSDEELNSVLRLARFIKGKGEFHAEKHVPAQTENRVFLFLDLKGSTALAERLGHRQYSRLLRSCYQDLTELIIRFGAEVYQFVGDEVVLCWEAEDAGAVSNGVRLFFGLRHKLREKSATYRSQFGLVPVFTGGMDAGPVTRTTVGGVKRETAYHGDVLNTAARLQGLCSQYGAALLVSEQVRRSATRYTDFRTTFEAKARLRGKSKKTEIYSVDLTARVIAPQTQLADTRN